MQPRHVLCFLGKQGGFLKLRNSIMASIDSFAKDFEIDDGYSQDDADDRMEGSFGICWDRVHPLAWKASDEQAVLDHGCVVYVLGPPMNANVAVDLSAIALRLVAQTLENGAIAAKGESAGVAHGVARWRQLGHDAERAKGRVELAGICRLALAKRPIADEECLSSVGFHLVGLPEVFVSRDLSDDELELASIIDRFADEMFEKGLEPTLARSGGERRPVEDYEEDDFKHNPYGAVYPIQP